ncbi:MAG: hypothetical protein ACRC2T_07095, partial [Thermoguttaceae bacterium]
LKALKESNSSEMRRIQGSIANALKKAGISLHQMDRLTIDVDSDGKLIFGGIKDKKTLARIEQLFSENTKLGVQLKSLAAKKAIVSIYERGGQELDEFLNSDKYDGLKTELLRGYLSENKVDLEKTKSSDGVITDEEGRLSALISDTPELEEEFTRLFDEKRLEREAKKAVEADNTKKANAIKTNSTAMFVFQNGRLLDQNVKSEQEIAGSLQKLLGIKVPGHKDAEKMGHSITINEAIELWNAENANSPENQIHDFKLTVSRNGKYSVTDVNAKSGKGNGQAGYNNVMMLESLFNQEFRKTLEGIAEEMFETHQAHHGDVADYVHQAEVQYEQGQFSYDMRSEEADNAALADIKEKTGTISADLTNFFQSKFSSMNPGERWSDHFENGIKINVDKDGKLSMDLGNISKKTLQNQMRFLGFVDSTIKALNERIMSDDPFAQTGFQNKLDPELEGTLKDLVGLQSDLKRIHDPAKRVAALQIG